MAAEVVGSHEVESLVTARSMVRGEVPKSEAVAGPAYGLGSMALLLVGAQRLQLIRLAWVASGKECSAPKWSGSCTSKAKKGR